MQSNPSTPTRTPDTRLQSPLRSPLSPFRARTLSTPPRLQARTELRTLRDSFAGFKKAIHATGQINDPAIANCLRYLETALVTRPADAQVLMTVRAAKVIADNPDVSTASSSLEQAIRALKDLPGQGGRSLEQELKALRLPSDGGSAAIASPGSDDFLQPYLRPADAGRHDEPGWITTNLAMFNAVANLQPSVEVSGLIRDISLQLDTARPDRTTLRFLMGKLHAALHSEVLPANPQPGVGVMLQYASSQLIGAAEFLPPQLPPELRPALHLQPPRREHSGVTPPPPLQRGSFGALLQIRKALVTADMGRADIAQHLARFSEASLQSRFDMEAALETASQQLLDAARPLQDGHKLAGNLKKLIRTYVQCALREKWEAEPAALVRSPSSPALRPAPRGVRTFDDARVAGGRLRELFDAQTGSQSDSDSEPASDRLLPRASSLGTSGSTTTTTTSTTSTTVTSTTTGTGGRSSSN